MASPINENIDAAAVAGVNVIIGKYLGRGDGFLTYLPLAHIIEFVFENACLF